MILRSAALPGLGLGNTGKAEGDRRTSSLFSVSQLIIWHLYFQLEGCVDPKELADASFALEKDFNSSAIEQLPVLRTTLPLAWRRYVHPGILVTFLAAGTKHLMLAT